LCSKIYTLQLFTKFRSPVWPLDPIRYPLRNGILRLVTPGNAFFRNPGRRSMRAVRA
jgi:hypothetical protein